MRGFAPGTPRAKAAASSNCDRYHRAASSGARWASWKLPREAGFAEVALLRTKRVQAFYKLGSGGYEQETRPGVPGRP